MSITTTALFVCLDDFAKTFEAWERERLIPITRKRQRKGKLSLGEMLFHLSPFKDFKHVWLHGAEREYGCRAHTAPFCAVRSADAQSFRRDSTKLAVRTNPRIRRNRTFKAFAARGHSTMGWFFGLKLHVMMNHRGELITPGNTDDCARRADMEGKLLADKGCISKKLFARLWD